MGFVPGLRYWHFPGNYSVFSGSVEFSYTLPFRTSVRSVQGIIHASSHPITAVKFGKVGSSTTYPCTLIPLGNSLYRFYLSRTDVIVNSNEFFIIVENDGSASTVASLLSFEFSQIRSSQYQETGTLYVTGGNLDGSFNETMANTADPVVCYLPKLIQSCVFRLKSMLHPGANMIFWTFG